MAEHSRNSIQEESAREARKLCGVRGEGSVWLGVLRSLGLFHLYTVGITEEYF